MKLFIDANVLVAVLNKEYPLFSYGAKILSLADRPNFALYTSPTVIAIAFYFATKKHGEALAKKKISILLEHLKITTIDEDCTKLAVKNPKINDLEDGIQYYSALNCNANYIITDDTNGFYYSEISVMEPANFLKQIIGGH